LALSMTRRAFVLGAAMAPLLARRTIAQAAFPSRPIRIVIGFPPGGGIDILARLMAPKMSERLIQPVVVENRPGANGLIATQGVAQSEPDGHTILFGTTGNLAVNPVLYAGRPGMNMERDFMPLSHVASLAFVLVARADERQLPGGITCEMVVRYATDLGIPNTRWGRAQARIIAATFGIYVTDAQLTAAAECLRLANAAQGIK